MALRNVIWLCIFVVVGGMFYTLSPLLAGQESVYRTYAPLVEVDALIRRQFVKPVDDRRLVHGAIRGMLRQLDPYSGYIAPDQMADFTQRNAGTYVGVGLELGMRRGAVAVIAPIHGSPAMRAGVQPGDTLLAIDGQPTEERSVFDVSAMLAGPPDSTVSVKIRRPDGDIATLTIAREPIHRPLVAGFRRNDDGTWDYILDREQRIAYIRIPHFTAGLAERFSQALAGIERQHADALIIDLRFNPGGVMTEAIAIVDRFVSDGTLLTTVTRRQAIDTYTATREQTDSEIRLAILINAFSASSSEIVAGSLQDHARAVIVGERSFGKGSAQSLIELHGGIAAIKLTTAHYQLPSGRIIHRTAENAATDDWGIIPDIQVALTQSEQNAVRLARPPRIDPQLQAAINALTNQPGAPSLQRWGTRTQPDAPNHETTYAIELPASRAITSTVSTNGLGGVTHNRQLDRDRDTPYSLNHSLHPPKATESKAEYP